MYLSGEPSLKYICFEKNIINIEIYENGHNKGRFNLPFIFLG